MNGRSPFEESRVHTRILRCALEVEESRAWWSHRDPATERPGADVVFNEWWFGDRSLERVEVLIQNMCARYDAFPEALRVLTGWRGIDQRTATLVCHWHLQLSDPLYRRFTGEFLPARRAAGQASITRDQVVRWVAAQEPGRWTTSTQVQFASKLLSAALSSGLVSGTKEPRPLLVPAVSETALGYCLYLLRAVKTEKPMLDGPYLRSVGLAGPNVEALLRSVPGISYRRLGDVQEVEWGSPDLATWARCHGLQAAA